MASNFLGKLLSASSYCPDSNEIRPNQTLKNSTNPPRGYTQQINIAGYNKNNKIDLFRKINMQLFTVLSGNLSFVIINYLYYVFIM